MERYVIMMLFLCVFQQQFSKSTCQVCTTRFTSTERVFAQKYTGSLLTAESSLAVGRFTWSLKASPLQFLCSSFSMVQGIYNATCTAGSPCSRSTLYVTNLPLSDNGAQFSITGSDAVSVSTTITVKGCPNITSAGVVQDVPSTAGFNDVHTFTCLPNYSLSSASPSTCQANATWNPTPVCNAVTTTTTAATTVTTTTIVAATTTSAFAATTTSKEPRARLDAVTSAMSTQTESVNSTTSVSGNYSLENKGLTGGQIAGIVIGVLLGIALIGGLVWFFVFRDQSESPKPNPEESDSLRRPTET